MRNRTTAAAARQAGRDLLVRRAILLMRQHIGEPLPIAQLAARLGASERKLERLFAAEFGVPPGRFGMALKLSHARWLLENTSRAITDVAAECGFADGSHFARCFRRRFGGTPSDLRRSRCARAHEPGASA